MHIYASRNPGGSAIARLTSLRQGFGGPPELQRRRKASRSSRALVGLVGQRGSRGSDGSRVSGVRSVRSASPTPSPP